MGGSKNTKRKLRAAALAGQLTSREEHHEEHRRAKRLRILRETHEKEVRIESKLLTWNPPVHDDCHPYAYPNAVADPEIRAIFQDSGYKANNNQPLQIVRYVFYHQMDSFHSFSRHHWYTRWISAALTVLRDNRIDLNPLQNAYLQACEEAQNQATQRSVFVARDHYIKLWYSTSEELYRPSTSEQKYWSGFVAWMENEVRKQKERDQSTSMSYSSLTSGHLAKALKEKLDANKDKDTPVTEDAPAGSWDHEKAMEEEKIMDKFTEFFKDVVGVTKKDFSRGDLRRKQELIDAYEGDFDEVCAGLDDLLGTEEAVAEEEECPLEIYD